MYKIIPAEFAGFKNEVAKGVDFVCDHCSTKQSIFFKMKDRAALLLISDLESALEHVLKDFKCPNCKIREIGKLPKMIDQEIGK